MDYSELIDDLFENKTNEISIISKILVNIDKWKSPKRHKKAWKTTFSYASKDLINALNQIQKNKKSKDYFNRVFNKVVDRRIDYLDHLTFFFSLRGVTNITSKVKLKSNKEFKSWMPGESRTHESIWLFDEEFKS